jgi:hypothetical protein
MMSRNAEAIVQESAISLRDFFSISRMYMYASMHRFVADREAASERTVLDET